MSDSNHLSSEMDSNSESDGDLDDDISTVLHYLIRSGQLRILAANSSNLDPYDQGNIFSEDEDGHLTEMNQQSEVKAETLRSNDLSHAILLNSGALNDKRTTAQDLTTPLPCMLRARELGMNGRLRFSQGDRCQITQRVLPNKCNIVDRYNGKVFCGSYARNGDLFMTAAQDYCVRVYDTKNQALFKLKRTVEARDVGWSILDTAVSPDGNLFVYCSWSESLHICNISGDYDVHNALPLYPEDRRFCVFALRFSQDGNEILCGANDHYLYVYNREINKRTLRIQSHVDDVNTVAFADSTSQIFFSASDDGLCKIWDRRTLCESSPKPVGIWAGHDDGITYVDPKGDGRYLITNSKDQSIKLWDMRVFSPSSCEETAYKTAKLHNWDYRWQRVPSSLPRHAAKRHAWDTSLMTYRGHRVLQTLVRCRFSPEAITGQRYIYTGCASGKIVGYDIITGEIVFKLVGHTGCVRDIAWHPYRNEIMSSSWDGTIAKWTHMNSCDEDLWQESDLSSSPDDDTHSHPRRSQRLADLRKKQALAC